MTPLMITIDFFNTYINPFLLPGLFILNLVAITIAIRAEKRAISKFQNDILKNAKRILADHKTLTKLAKDNKKIHDIIDSHEEEPSSE